MAEPAGWGGREGERNQFSLSRQNDTAQAEAESLQRDDDTSHHQRTTKNCRRDSAQASFWG